MSGAEEVSLFDTDEIVPACDCQNPFCRRCNPVPEPETCEHSQWVYMNGCPGCIARDRAKRADPRGEIALANAPEWRAAAQRWFATLEIGATFTSEDLTKAVGYPAGTQAMNRNNAVGWFIGTLSRQGKIKAFDAGGSRQPRSHGARIVTWRKL